MEPESFWSLLDDMVPAEKSEKSEKVRIYLRDGKYFEIPSKDISTVDDHTAELTPPGKLIYVDVRSITHVDFIEYTEEKSE